MVGLDDGSVRSYPTSSIDDVSSAVQAAVCVEHALPDDDADVDALAGAMGMARAGQQIEASSS